MYDFFVAKFNKYLILFYDRYLEAEKDHIYTSFYLEDIGGKNKDISSIYADMVFSNDASMSLIVANLQYVLSHLKEMPVSDEYIYYTIYNDNNISNLLSQNLMSDKGIFRIFNKILFNNYLYPTIITHLRMQIQSSHQQELKIDAGETK